MCVTCPTHLNLLDLITLIICGEEYKITMLLLMLFSPACYYLSVRYQYFSQHGCFQTLSNCVLCFW
jgi:hypothetical protein